MDYKKSKAPVNTVTRDIMDLAKDTDNIYESVSIIAKRAKSCFADSYFKSLSCVLIN